MQGLFGKIFGTRSGTVAGAAALLGVASLASRLVGVVRDRLLSGTFGAGADLDAYYAAFRAPDLIYNLFVLGAITAGFIPVFTTYLAGGKDEMTEEANELASAVMTVLGSLLLGLAVFGIIAAPFFVPLLAPGFDAAGQALTIKLARIMFLSPVFLGLSGVLGGILQTRRRFFIYALAPVLYNVGIIAGTLTLSRSYGVAGVAAGVALGAAMHFLVQLWACAASGFRYRFAWKPGHKGVRDIARLTAPRTLSLAVSQVNLVLLTGMASTLGAGGLAVFSLANNLQSLPVGVIGVSFAVAAFPLIAELASKRDDAAFVAALAKTAKTILFLVVPATVAIVLLRAQLVRVILGTGRFDWADTIATADTLSFFALSLFAQALLPLLARAFFAYHDAKTPLIAAAFTVVVERVLAWKFAEAGMGAPGLALAFSASTVLNVLILYVALRLRFGDLRERAMLRSIGLMSVAGLLMAATMQGTKIAVGAVVDMRSFLGIFSQGLAAGVTGIGTYVAVAYAMGSEEAREVIRLYARKVMPVRAPEIVQEDDTIVT